MTNIGSLFSHHARYRADHAAIVAGGRSRTYSEFNREINRLANALLALGVNKHDRVATLLPNGPEAIEVFWACAKIGAAVVTLDARLHDDALASCLRVSDATMLVTQSGFSGRVTKLKPQLSGIARDRYLLTDGRLAGFRDYQGLKSAADAREPEGELVTGDDPCDIACSPHATAPGMTVHTHRIRAAYGTSFASTLRVNPDSVILSNGGVPFETSLVGLMPVIFSGATYVLMPGFDPASCLESTVREKATHVMLMPSQADALLDAPACLPATPPADTVLSVEAPMRSGKPGRTGRALTGRLSLVFGFQGGFFTVLAGQDQVRKPSCAGVPLPFFEMKIVSPAGKESPAGEVGEIWVRGPTVVTRHCRTPELAGATRDVWSPLGELGFVDEEGFLYLVQRQTHDAEAEHVRTVRGPRGSRHPMAGPLWGVAG